MENYLNLNRWFLPFTDEESWEASYNFFGRDEPFGAVSWKALVDRRRVILLAEAGAGKTAEMWNFALESTAIGCPAFYVTVNEICQKSLRHALQDPGTQSLFDDWLSSDKDGTFLVDSLDEARLDGHKFREALSEIAKSLHNGLHRAKIVISCRVSDWRAIQDAVDFNSMLCAAADSQIEEIQASKTSDEALLAPVLQHSEDRSDDDEDSTEETMSIFTLAPLTRQQSEILADWRGVTNVSEFMDSVIQSDAEGLANRPQDLIALADLWIEKKRMGSKYEILRWSVEKRLKESNLDRVRLDQLAADEAITGACLVAAAMTLGHKRFLSWPIEPQTESVDGLALDPAKVLTSWSPNKQLALVDRAIFDPASLGRVRFHHRSVQELLCAQWLLHLVEAGCPIGTIWNLVAEEIYGTKVLRPTLRPVTSWLAQLNHSIGKRVVEIAPEAIIEGGDPSILPLQAKADLITAFSEKYSGRSDAGLTIPIDQVLRLSDRRLAPTIRRLWRNSSDSEEVSDLLLRLIWVGKIVDCSDIVFDCALSRRSRYQRTIAIRALADFGSQKYLKNLATHVLKFARSMGSRLVGETVQAVYPRALNESDLSAVIKKTQGVTMGDVQAGLVHGLEQISKEAKIRHRLTYVGMLYDLVRLRPYVHHHRLKISERFKWLLSPLMLVCARYIKESNGSKTNTLVIEVAIFAANAARISSEYQVREAEKALHESVKENPSANYQIFWTCVNDQRKKYGDLAGYWQARRTGNLWNLTLADFDLLLKDIQKRRLRNDRFVALTAAVDIVAQCLDRETRIQRIRDTIASDPRLSEALDRILNPPMTEEDEDENRWKEIEKENVTRREADRKGVEESWLSFRNGLLADAEASSLDLKFSDLWDLSSWLRYNHRQSRYSLGDWQLLKPAFGETVAMAAKDAFVAFWRTFEPPLKSENPKLGTTNGAIVGLIGLQIESSDTTGWATSLTPKEIRHAARYALNELNGIPGWAQSTWVSRKAALKRMMVAETKWELTRRPVQSGGLHYLLSMFSYFDEPLRSICAKWVLDALDGTRVNNLSALHYSLKTITMSHADFSERLAALSEIGFKSTRIRGRKLLWLTNWIACDAEAAILELGNWIRHTKRNQRDQLFLDFLSTLFDSGDLSLGENYRDFLKFDNLTKLLPLVYEHIRVADDIYHVGSYSPGRRDNAERARGYLLTCLVDTPGEKTYTKLIELSTDPTFAVSAERLQVLAKRRAIADSDLSEWSPGEVLQFAETHESLPTSTKELYNTILNRLDEIEDDIVNGDYSNKQLLRQDSVDRADERVVQIEFAKELKARSRGVYSLEREPEVINANEPDLRVQRSGIPVGVPIEIKVADSWSYNELLEGISGQLIAKYLRPKDAKYGVFLMTYHGKKGGWRKLPGEPLLNIDDLCKDLQTQADRLVANDDHLDEICVFCVKLID